MSETVLHFPRGVNWFSRVASLPRTARHWCWSMVRRWSWPALKYLFRGSAILTAYAFSLLWLWCLLTEKDFDEHFRSLGKMMVIAFVQSLVLMLSTVLTLPNGLAPLCMLLLFFFVLYGLFTTGKND
jgi:hypothetical protein